MSRKNQSVATDSPFNTDLSPSEVHDRVEDGLKQLHGLAWLIRNQDAACEIDSNSVFVAGSMLVEKIEGLQKTLGLRG